MGQMGCQLKAYNQWYAPQGKPWTQDSVRLRPDGVLTQQGSSPKPTIVGDKILVRVISAHTMHKKERMVYEKAFSQV